MQEQSQRRNRLGQELEQGRQKLKQLIQRAILRRRFPYFQRLMKDDKAWALYVMVIKKYIKRCKDKKLATNYARASAEQKKLLEHMDIELSVMENLIELPARAIKQALVAEHEKAEQGIVEEVTADVRAESKDSGG